MPSTPPSAREFDAVMECAKAAQFLQRPSTFLQGNFSAACCNLILTNLRTYLITDSIIDLYYTQIVGDPNNRPIIKAASTFSMNSFGLIDANPYLPNGALSWNSTNNFFRQIRNLIIDTTALPPEFPAVGIHWPSSQATSITNCAFYLSRVQGNKHTGLFIEEGSGGLLNDLAFYGGGNATVLGNQQYTARNLWFSGADVAIFIPWNWGWTYKSLYIENCRVGIQMDGQSLSVGSITVVDSWFQGVVTAISTTRLSTGVLGSSGTVAMENVRFENVEAVLTGPNGVDVLDRTVAPSGNDVFIMVGNMPFKGNSTLTYCRATL